jgi:hypothetical protein
MTIANILLPNYIEKKKLEILNRMEQISERLKKEK